MLFTKKRLPKWALACLLGSLFACFQLLCFCKQYPIERHEGQGWDGVRYVELSQNLLDGHWQANAPFAARVGVPYMVAQAKKNYPQYRWADLFFCINWLGTAFYAVLSWFWIQKHLPSTLFSVLLWIIVQAHWLGGLRFVWFYPVQVDIWSMVFFLASLYTYSLWREANKEIGWLYWFSGCCILLGVLVREYVLLAALTWAFEQRICYRKRLLWISCGALLWGGCQLLPVQTGSYNALAKAWEWLRHKSLLDYLLSYFYVYTLLPFWLWPMRKQMFSLTSWWLIGIGIALLAWVGGSDTERFLIWGQCLQLLWVIQLIKNQQCTAWFKILTVAILFSLQSHLLMPISEPLLEVQNWLPIFWTLQKGSFLAYFAIHASSYTNCWALLEYILLNLAMVLIFRVQQQRVGNKFGA
ncbi:MAG: hypothetical protein EAZ57_03635 [Cytophagales bacterium]|nr:MAG: hypothetical protein EAZ67_04100 [Cytophagales bacterium]TAF61554.1 MAG: hypothetical protein EAZ57_03635 [Cytophagales bacterium]